MKSFTAADPVFITSGIYLNGLGASSPIMLLSKQNEVESLYTGRQRGRVVRASDLKSVGRGFKSRSDH